ncbi:PQQ-binding-like beta-propeller repeat protein [Ktedonobacter robiniae]|uniref:Bulb-type lectin domain-containing protein n=1 Tax=Ktedonobacter robiniae TaxID=2778365 RepID=A0ABQ3UHJ3_9CHLR|nr:PQQ-binding-like beta-propeller repeat protein [Ktedonobacter robiniae]GHO52055.1 hypothetical protein KSB_05300 [Ktedonobacter robiniae]
MHRKQHVFLALFAFFVSISLVACGGSSTASSAPAKAQVTPKPTRIIDRDNGYLYYTTPQGIYQIHTDTGHPGWKTPQVVAYSLQNGHSLWTSNAPAPGSGINTTGNSAAKVTVIQPGAESDTNTYAVLGDGTVYAFDPQGKLVWNKQLYAINIISYARPHIPLTKYMPATYMRS